MKHIFRITLAITAVLCFSLTVSNAQTYDVIPVNVPEFSQCLGLNVRAQLPAYTLAGFGAGARNPFLWSDGQIIQINSGLGETRDINDSGQVVGWLGIQDPGTSSPYPRAFIFDNGNLTFLDKNTEAYAINNRGQVVGKMNILSTPVPEHAFLYSEGVTTDLGALPGTRTSMATDINDAGQVVGWSQGTGQNPLVHAFLYSGGTMTNIGTIAGTHTEATAINDLGDVVGFYYPNANSTLVRGFLYRNGVMQDLGSLPGDTFIYPYDINNAGQVVGISHKLGVSSRPFLYSDGQMIDLSQYQARGPRATAINNYGQILLSGTDAVSILNPRPAAAPSLLKAQTESAIALDSVTFVRDPFPVASALNFSSDHRTRVMLFVTGLGMSVNPAIITAQAEDSQHHVQSLTVEHVGSVPNFEWITQINVILPVELNGAGEVLVSVSAGGTPSNQALLNIK